METSLHQQLKQHYAGANGEVEARLGRYRIDAIRRGLLIEIQHGGLAAIRDKVRELLADHKVLVVKPIVARKRIVKLDKKQGKVVSQRLSPKRGTMLDVFAELVHFTRVFPHRGLTIETPLVEIEEHRYPGHGRRRRWRKNDFVIADQQLVSVGESLRFRRPACLRQLLPDELPREFDTGELAKLLETDRSTAQRMAYCLRETGAVKMIGKRGNALVYRQPRRRRAA